MAWPSLKRAEANLLRACDDIGICSMGLRALSEYWHLLASAMETDWNRRDHCHVVVSWWKALSIRARSHLYAEVYPPLYGSQ